MRLTHALAVFTLVVLLAPDVMPAAAQGLSTFAKAKHHEKGNGQSLGMVVAGHPLAAEAGAEILRRGGNAVDAAAAVQWALNVVEPYMTGIGGGGFVMLYDAKSEKVVVLDGRETAPAAATPDMFFHAGVKIIGSELVHQYEGLAVGVPGVVKVWDHAVANYGKLPLADTFEPAIRLAEDGFAMDPNFAGMIKANIYLDRVPYSDRMVFRNLSVTLIDAGLRTWPPSVQQFYKNTVCAPDPIVNPPGPAACAGGTYYEPGDLFVQKDLAKSFRLLQQHGPKVFYEGEIAQAIVRTQAMREGRMTLADLAGYEIKVRQPLHTTYHGNDVYSMPPPSSGGVATQQMLKILEPFDLRSSGHDTVQTRHLMFEAMKLAYGDRHAYLADADHTYVPVQGLLNPDYLAERRALIDPHWRTNGTLSTGDPYRYDPGAPSPESPQGQDEPVEGSRSHQSHTAHFVVADREGNVVTTTTTVNFSFGTGMLVPGYGFVLNNELLDFRRNSTSHPNSAGPLKRPMSSMTPTLVFRDGEPLLAIGAAGGPNIPLAVLQVTLASLDHGVPIQQAIDSFRILTGQDAEFGDHEVYWEWPPRVVPLELKQGLEARGHVFWGDPIPEPFWLGSVHAIRFGEGGRWAGGTDHRAEMGGVVEAFGPGRGRS